MKTFIMSVLFVQLLSISASANSVEDLDVSVLPSDPINPISVVEKKIYYPSAAVDEDQVVTVFISTFKGWTSKLEDEVDENVGIFY